MKRLLIAAVASLSLCTAAVAQGFSFLRPPTVAVMDFEVSMLEVKDVNKEFYGQLVSQAIVSALVQQNAAKQVLVPPETIGQPGSLSYPDPPVARKSVAAVGSYRNYFPPIFKIFDKKYVELALQENAFASKDLYAKSAGAYAFAELDFLILGNVYATSSPTSEAGAIGLNVRVLNTKRAEELYSYTAVVDDELRELPAASARIAQLIMRDILNNHCAQFKVSESAELSGAAQDADGRPIAARTVTDDYLLFWQSRQVVADDATVIDSNDTHKRLIERDSFYWALPGQYVVSVYRKDVQQLKAIPFTLTAGEIRHVTVEPSHLVSQDGTVTIGGILPSDAYTFDFVPQGQSERYWWEIDRAQRLPPSFKVIFEDGAIKTKGEQEVAVEYRPSTSEIIMRGVKPARYQVTATAQPPSGSGSITGWWVVSSQLSTTSAPLPLDLRNAKETRINIADFRLQVKKALVAPRTNKITFLMEPGFSATSFLVIDDRINRSLLYWEAKEKVTVSSEYSQADWDSYPEVTYSFLVSYPAPRSAPGGERYLSFSRSFRKADLEPSRDTVVVLDLEAIRRSQEEEALAAAKAAAAAAPLVAARGEATQAAAAPAAAPASSQPPAQSVAGTKPGAGPAQPGPSSTMVQLGFGVGGGTLSYKTRLSPTSFSTVSHEATGFDIAFNGAAMWPVSPALGLGLGAFGHVQTLDADSISDLEDIGSDVESVFGFALTGNMAIVEPKSGAVFTLDVGYGTGFSAGLGFAVTPPGAAGGVHLRVGLMVEGVSDLDITVDGDDYPASDMSFSVMLGYFGGR
ncbi:MAG: hypothetical protein KKA67_10420 [Spirochaetes bacterium]|nr:hypothetical protein [Spirochaetota bacterium]